MRFSFKLGLVMAFVVVFLGIGFLMANKASPNLVENSTIFVQDGEEINVLPSVLERISWSGIFAGSFLSLIMMFLLNLLGITLGLSQFNPENRYDSGDASGIATGTMVWIAVSNLLALFAGGWVAAYFAGIPEGTDGLLHGIMVWAVTSLITVLLVMTGLGKVMNGVAMLVSSGLNLTGSLAGGAAHVTSGAVNTAGNVLGTAGNVAAQAASILSHGVQSSAQIVGNSFSQMSDTAIENMPIVQNAISYQDLTLDDIRYQARKLLWQAGEDPDMMMEQVKAAGRELQDGVRQAVRNPQDLSRILDITLNRVFTRGEMIASEVDRESLLNLLAENGNLSREEAEQQLQRWEEQFNQVKQQTQQAREMAMQKAEEFRKQAEQKAQEVYQMAQVRVEEMQKEVENRLNQAKEEAEKTAREAAQAAKETFTKVATAVAVAMIVGAIAAAAGGYFGAPESLPDIDADAARADIQVVANLRITPVHYGLTE